ncbi:hypothetical protein CDO73_26215 [Saccharibacillus sp. O23]|uniref:Alp7A family actin-like protein n=1 Tax=Saccharibacillus sp. O23 TaxID=2009338 RepID=UPI000B4E4DD4|nr:plasmid segregation protein ParM domain-containing protein [Saccharibacillus sp. O23]OWR25675.1 hypothetical protein CDO73_26215 [Saccharibacillus sp. O23]
MEIFSLDLGNKQVKLVSSKTIGASGSKEKTNPIKAKILPAHFLDYSDLGDQRTAVASATLDINKYKSGKDPDYEYAWGTDLHRVHAEDKFISTIGFQNRYSRREFAVLADMAIGQLALDFPESKTGILEVIVTTGVPTEDFNDTSIDSITKTLLGDHNVIINDESMNIRVKEVIVNPQPAGTAYNEVLDNEGYIIDDQESLLEEQIAVIDIGGGTLLVDTLKNMNLSDPHAQKPTGAHELYDRIVRLVVESGIRGITSYEVEQLLRHSDPREGYFYKPNKNESFSITEHVEKAISKYSRDVMNTVSTTLKGSTKIDHVLFTGGTSNLLQQAEAKREYPFARFVKDSEIANALGFYKAALATVASRSE